MLPASGWCELVGWLNPGQKASVAQGPAASATISHFPRLLRDMVSPQGGLSLLTVNPVIVRPPFPRRRPRNHATGPCELSVILDIVRSGCAINPFPERQDIQLSQAGEAD